MKHVVWVVALALGCGNRGDADVTRPPPAPAPSDVAPPPPAPTPDAAQRSPMELELDWTMKVDGARLRIDYTFHNRSKRPVVVVDQLTVGPKHAPDAIIVMNADGLAKTVAFVRAFVRTNEKLVYTPFPGGRAVAAGADLKGTAFADLPLHMWHNFSKLPPLTGDATQAVLEIGYLEEPVTFRGLKLANATLQIPVEMAKQKLLRSKSLPLPP